MKKQILSLIAVTVGLSACQKTGSDYPFAPKETPAPVEVTQQHHVIDSEKTVNGPQGIEFSLKKDSNKFLFNGERSNFISSLNKYTVVLRMPHKIHRDTRLYKTDLESGQSEELEYEKLKSVDGKVQYTDSYELPYKEYKTRRISYQVVTDEGQLLAEAEFKLLPDLYLSGYMTSTELGLKPGVSTFANIVLNNATLQTDGYTYNLIAEKFFSENSKLTSYSRKSIDERGATGRSGGLVEVITRHAEGNLTAELHGENGGPGYPDPNSNYGNPGGRGGNSGNLYFTYETGEIEIRNYSEVGEGGAGGWGALTRGAFGYDGEHEKSCITKKGNEVCN